MVDDRWITFDCFGTLIDWRAGFRKILSTVAGVRAGVLLRAYDEAERARESERPHYLYRYVLTVGLSRAAQRSGIDLAPKDADLLVRSWDELPLFPEVPEALDALRAAGWKIGVLTNCDNDLFAATLASNPALRPDVVITAEEVGNYKPAFGHFLRFESRTGVSRQNWVHAANSWFHDIDPARRFGVTRIWVDRDKTGNDPTAASSVVDNVAALPGELNRVVGTAG
jgi:2-haloacid dehalogenase